jgi:hypothetical protein
VIADGVPGHRTGADCEPGVVAAIRTCDPIKAKRSAGTSVYVPALKRVCLMNSAGPRVGTAAVAMPVLAALAALAVLPALPGR